MQFGDRANRLEDVKIKHFYFLLKLSLLAFFRSTHPTYCTEITHNIKHILLTTDSHNVTLLVV
jgi:hypothetical protein